MQLTVHRPTLRRLARDMGIRLPVYVTLVNYPRTRNQGRYCGRPGDGRRHSVAIARGLTVSRANLVLCHELTHVRQCEAIGPGISSVREFERRWWAEMRDAGITRRQVLSGTMDPAIYESTPLERDAWDGAYRWWPECERMGNAIRGVSDQAEQDWAREVLA